jgi:hypothetical protein
MGFATFVLVCFLRLGFRRHRSAKRWLHQGAVANRNREAVVTTKWRQGDR